MLITKLLSFRGRLQIIFFNITETNNNLKYYNGTDWRTVQLHIGGYKAIDDFNTRIKSIVENKDNITLEADTISLKTNFFWETDIDFNIEYSFGELLGFEKIVVGNSTSTESTRVVEITLIKNVSVQCNLVSSSYLNGKKTNILYRFTIPAALGYDFEIYSYSSGIYWRNWLNALLKSSYIFFAHKQLLIMI